MRSLYYLQSIFLIQVARNKEKKRFLSHPKERQINQKEVLKSKKSNLK